MKILLSLVGLLVLVVSSDAYNVHPNELSRDDIAGIWCLTRQKSLLPSTPSNVKSLEASYSSPKPTFVPPSSSEEDEDDDGGEMFLKLLEDGSFEQFGSFDASDRNNDDYDDDDDDDDDDVEEIRSESPSTKLDMDSSSKSKTSDKSPSSDPAPTNTNKKNPVESILGLSLMKGTWDYIDGKLILATDRPPSTDRSNKVHDTVLEGRVVATSEKSLTDNPILFSDSQPEIQLDTDDENQGGDKKDASDTVLSKSKSSFQAKSNPDSNKENNNDNNNNNLDEDNVDTHLSVPNGKIKIGKFMYPKNHPSFFEQTIFHPNVAGSFCLRQVLGSLNTKRREEEEPEIIKFHREDLIGKKFFLASRPLKYQPKGKLRWNRSLGQYIEEKPKSEPEEIADIQAMNIHFFPNNTFSTYGGVSGDHTKILRGKWAIIGYDHDQLWMQVLRFGFGREVSGSTYSEGTHLTQDDERSYWGTIREVIQTQKIRSNDNHLDDIYEIQKEEENDNNDDDDWTMSSSLTSNSEGEDVFMNSYSDPSGSDEQGMIVKKTLEIRGSVLFGWGLEPEPIGRFTMIEQTEEEDYDDEEEDEDVDDADRQKENDDDETTLFDSIFE